MIFDKTGVKMVIVDNVVSFCGWDWYRIGVKGQHVRMKCDNNYSSLWLLEHWKARVERVE